MLWQVQSFHSYLMNKSILFTLHFKRKKIRVSNPKQIYISHLSMHLELLRPNQFHLVFCWNTIVIEISLFKCECYMVFAGG